MADFMADYDTKIIPILDDIIEDRTTENGVAQDTDSVQPDEPTNPAENSLDLFSDEPEHLDNDDRSSVPGAIDDIDEQQFDEFQYDAQQCDESLYDEYEHDDDRPLDFATTRFTALHTEISNDGTENEAENIEPALIDFHRTVEDDNSDPTADTYPIVDNIIEATAETDTSDADLSAFDPITFDPITFIRPSAPDTTDGSLIEASIETTVDAPVDTQYLEPQAVVNQAIENQAAQSQSLESVVDDIVKQLIPDLEQQLRFLVQQALEDRLPDAILAQLMSKNTKS